MSELTVSEAAFEQFCDETQIRRERIETHPVDGQQPKAPDYVAYFEEHRIFVEVKELTKNPGPWPDTKSRLRRHIKSANPQLKKRIENEGAHPAIVVLYDNAAHSAGIDETDVKEAMYGDETAVVAVSLYDSALEPVLRGIRLGGNRRCTPDQGTTISAVGLLAKWGQEYRLSLFHNCYAKHRLEPCWLRREAVHHFVIDARSGKAAWPEWRCV